MALNEKKLSAALGFLSLELIKPLERELRLPACVTDAFRIGLREVLNEYVRTGCYYDDFPSSNYRIYQWVIKEIGVEAWHTIIWWTECIFLHAEDRQIEETWIIILAYGCSDLKRAGELEPNLYERVKKVQAGINDGRSQVHSKVTSMKEHVLHNWDSAMLPCMYYENADFIFETILLICTSNLLIEQWENKGIYLFEDLAAIHNWGKIIGSELGHRKVDVPFPGVWKLSPCVSKIFNLKT